MKTAIIILWIVWVLLFLAWPLDMMIALLRDPGEAMEPDRKFAAVLGFIGFLSICLTFLIKWFVLRFLIHPKRVGVDSPWATVLLVAGSLMIWGLTKSVETYGLVIFFGSELMVYYLVFWVPSMVVMLIHMPFLLDPRRARIHLAESGSEDQVPAQAISETE